MLKNCSILQKFLQCVRKISCKPFSVDTLVACIRSESIILFSTSSKSQTNEWWSRVSINMAGARAWVVVTVVVADVEQCACSSWSLSSFNFLNVLYCFRSESASLASWKYTRFSNRSFSKNSFVALRFFFCKKAILGQKIEYLSSGDLYKSSYRFKIEQNGILELTERCQFL
jgi:hypothetical protein